MLRPARSGMSEKTRVENLTGAPLRIVNDRGEVVTTYPESLYRQPRVRCGMPQRLEGFPFPAFGTDEAPRLDWVPPMESGVVYVVTPKVADMLRGREDVFVPASPILDDHGNVLGSRRLNRVSRRPA